MLNVLSKSGVILRVQTWELGADPWQLEAALVLRWPSVVGSVSAGLAEVVCVGPTDWLVLIGAPSAGETSSALFEACRGTAFRATEVTDSLARLELTGSNARAVLEKGCALDLHPTVYPPGRAARTRLAGLPVILWCRGAMRFECIVTASLRETLSAWLTDAALEF